MAEQFHEFLFGQSVLLEDLVDYLIEQPGLHSCGTSDGRGVEHDDERESHGQSENRGPKSRVKSDRCGQAYGQGRMGARHAADTDEVAEIDAAGLMQVAYHLCSLRKQPSAERRPERRILKYV